VSSKRLVDNILVCLQEGSNPSLLYIFIDVGYVWSQKYFFCIQSEYRCVSRWGESSCNHQSSNLTALLLADRALELVQACLPRHNDSAWRHQADSRHLPGALCQPRCFHVECRNIPGSIPNVLPFTIPVMMGLAWLWSKYLFPTRL
jgi:hypothetical protein